MISCAVQYVVCFVNLVIVAAFSASQICCQSRQNQLSFKVRVLIIMPLVTTSITAGVAAYYLAKVNGAECIYFGS